jgi:hypothetical protein
MEKLKFKNIYQKLLYIQKCVVGLGKDSSTNTYKYVSGVKILGEIKPIMNNIGLILKTEVLDIENVRMDYATRSNPNKSEINSKVMMRFTWVDTDTLETDVNLFGANGQNDWDKGVGSALTYAERYFLMKYFHIATDEDDVDNKDKTERQEQIAVKKEAEILELLSKCTTIETLTKAYKENELIIKNNKVLMEKVKTIKEFIQNENK